MGYSPYQQVQEFLHQQYQLGGGFPTIVLEVLPLFLGMMIQFDDHFHVSNGLVQPPTSTGL